nr:MAG TPA: hypothetical protein [Caudoviricetes sp.]
MYGSFKPSMINHKGGIVNGAYRLNLPYRIRK